MSGNSCPDCTAGKYSGAAGSTTCQTCSSGTFSTTTSSVCTTCTAGTYASNAGAIQCTDCAAGTYSGAGASVCLECAIGTESAAGSSICTDCVAGKYVLNGVCTDCAAGTYTATAKQTRCKICQKGKYNTATGQSTCTWCSDVHCPAGQQSACGGSSDSNTCVDCPANFYKEVAGTSRCFRCSNFCQESSNLANYADWERYGNPEDLSKIYFDEYQLISSSDWSSNTGTTYDDYLESVRIWSQYFSRNESFINPFKKLDDGTCGGSSSGTCTACAANEYSTSGRKHVGLTTTKTPLLPCRQGWKVGAEICHKEASYCFTIHTLVQISYHIIMRQTFFDMSTQGVLLPNITDWMTKFNGNSDHFVEGIQNIEPPPSNFDFHQFYPHRSNGLYVVEIEQYGTNGVELPTESYANDWQYTWYWDDDNFDRDWYCADESVCRCPSNSQFQIVECPHFDHWDRQFRNNPCYDCIVP